jgi:Methyltransferase domain
VSSDHNFKRWFRGAAPPAARPAGKATAAPRTVRRCIGLGEFMRDLKGTEDNKLCILDLGPTSPANIAFLTDRNMRVYNVDILRGANDPSLLARQDDGSERMNQDKFFAENLAYPEGHFDAILCWDAADYLPEELVKPVVERLHGLLKPKGSLSAFFHTKDAGPDSPHSHYHIVQPDMLEMEEGPALRLQRIFNNRHIENLFKDFASRKFFLGRDNIREVIVVR